MQGYMCSSGGINPLRLSHPNAQCVVTANTAAGGEHVGRVARNNVSTSVFQRTTVTVFIHTNEPRNGLIYVESFRC